MQQERSEKYKNKYGGQFERVEHMSKTNFSRADESSTKIILNETMIKLSSELKENLRFHIEIVH